VQLQKHPLTFSFSPLFLEAARFENLLTVARGLTVEAVSLARCAEGFDRLHLRLSFFSLLKSAGILSALFDGTVNSTAITTATVITIGVTSQPMARSASPTG